MDGVVSIGLELMVGKELGLPTRLDFRRGNKQPFEIIEKRLDTEIQNLQVERGRDYPSERKLDGICGSNPVLCRHVWGLTNVG